MINDIPDSLSIKIRREKYLAKRALQNSSNFKQVNHPFHYERSQPVLGLGFRRAGRGAIVAVQIDALLSLEPRETTAVDVGFDAASHLKHGIENVHFSFCGWLFSRLQA